MGPCEDVKYNNNKTCFGIIAPVTTHFAPVENGRKRGCIIRSLSLDINF